MKQKSSIQIGLLLIIIMMLGVSCEQERTSAELIKSLEGRWLVEEDDPIYSKTKYYVNISISSQDSSVIFISNFYQCDDEVEANVEGRQINLVSDQTITVNTISYTVVSGSGTITDDYRNIDWRYKVDDGSGEVYTVTAVYTKK